MMSPTNGLPRGTRRDALTTVTGWLALAACVPSLAQGRGNVLEFSGPVLLPFLFALFL